MNISREWLQTYFEKELPKAEALAEALTFHAFEIESVENNILDVKVTPNRGHDCLSHRGIAKELSAILDIPLKQDPLREAIELKPTADSVVVSIENPELCPRYIAGYVRGITVGPSPEWLKKRLEAIGQKSINNVVDATNYVMFDLGQPLHAFDAGELKNKDSRFKIEVRAAKKGENMVALDDKEYKLEPNNLVIANAGAAIGIAGVKGGKPSGVSEETKDIILESANFNGVSVRKTAQALKLRTDASERFQQVLSPELAAYGMRAAAELIVKLTGGELVGFTDEYPSPQTSTQISVSAAKINQIVGTKLSENDMADVFARLGLPFENNKGVFTTHIPFERLDLVIPEDIAEEVGRIVGYDQVPSVELSLFPKKPGVNKNFYWSERIREDLMADGYSEVYTSVFRESGEREVLNKVGGERPFLRSNLTDGLSEALEKNIRSKELLGISEVRLFEIGVAWRGGKEDVLVGVASEKGGISEKPLSEMAEKLPEGTSYEPLPTSPAERYQSFSRYPYIVRDVALWVPGGTEADEVLHIIRANAGELLVRSEKFDEFKKGDKISYAFRLVFQSFDRTLTDDDANSRMESVYAALKSKGFEIR
jgi:phenylalanyl-tRNA synthetase beta chain